MGLAGAVIRTQADRPTTTPETLGRSFWGVHTERTYGAWILA